MFENHSMAEIIRMTRSSSVAEWVDRRLRLHGVDCMPTNDEGMPRAARPIAMNLAANDADYLAPFGPDEA